MSPNQDLRDPKEDSAEFQELVEYIRENKAAYGVDKLRKGLLHQGVSYVEIKKAFQLIEEEEERKIAGFLKETEDDEASEDSILMDDFEGGSKRDIFKKKANRIIGDISNSIGGSKKMGKLYLDVCKYGAISFLFFSTIVYFFKYLGGAYVYPRIAASAGVFSPSAILPDAFLSQFTFWTLLLLLAWSMIVGGILTVVFLKYLAKVWPFANWFKLQQKLFAFYVIYEFVVSIFINGIISSFSFVHLVGYLIVTIGIVLGGYLSSNYLANVLENKYEDQIRQITR